MLGSCTRSHQSTYEVLSMLEECDGAILDCETVMSAVSARITIEPGKRGGESPAFEGSGSPFGTCWDGLEPA